MLLYMQMYKHLGLLLILIGWILAAVLIFKWRNKDLPTISGHGASSRKAAILFAITLVGLGVPFYLWIVTWLAPYLKLGIELVVVATLAVVLNILTAIVADTTGWRKAVHRMAAIAMFILFLIMSVMIVTAPSISSTAQIIGWLALACILISGTIVIASNIGRRHSLMFQTLFLMSVHVVILSAVYL